jgi:alpha-1,2-mannosyltransferase
MTMRTDVASDVRAHRTLVELPVIRALHRLGPILVARWVLIVLFLIALVAVVTSIRPDLRDPTAVGSDPANYYAAGQRLLAGHDLYRLLPGDRPIPADAPPFFSVPFLSPPTVAVPWVALALLPGGVVMPVWWATCAVIAIAFGLWVVATARPAGLALFLPLLYGLAIMAWAGNVNAILLALGAVAWAGFTRETRRGDVAAGVAVGLSAVMKVTPILLFAWLIGQRRWRAVAAGAVTMAVVATAGLLVAGPAGYAEYLSIASATNASGSTPLSLTHLLEGAGVAATIATRAPLVLGGILALVALAVRRAPTAFELCVLASIVASPVVRIETLAYALLLALPAMLVRTPSLGLGRVRSRLAAVGTTIAAVAVLAFVVAVPPVSSRVVIDNLTDQDLVVRFATGAPMSFGYLVPSHTSGLAWAMAAGHVRGSVVVVSATCTNAKARLVERSGTLGIQPDEIAASSSAPPARVDTPLTYDARCAAGLYEP